MTAFLMVLMPFLSIAVNQRIPMVMDWEIIKIRMMTMMVSPMSVIPFR